jgi:flagellar biosynthetic protein FliR
MGGFPGGEIGEFEKSAVLGTFILFCRIGGCLMIAPGLSGAQIPTQIRLLVAVAVTLALAPLLLGNVKIKYSDEDPLSLTRLIVMESLIGLMIGLLGRAFFSALESMSSAAAMFLGLTNPFGVELEAGQMTAPITTTVMFAATAILFAGDFHWEILRGLVASYKAIPMRTDFDAAYGVRQLADVLGQAFLVAVRVASPFFLYSVIANFTLALVNRVTPQISVFFVAPPFVAAGGLLVLYLVAKSEIEQFLAAFATWLSWG